MITLSALVFDPLGSVSLDELPSSDMDGVSRRVNRAKTLDGGVVINDGGFSHGDRTFRVRWRIKSEADFERVQRMARLYSRVHVATRRGLFLAVPESVTRSGRDGTITLMIEELIA